MAETRENMATKEIETRVSISLQDEIKNMEVKFQSQLIPMQATLNEVLQHIKGKKYLEENYEPHGEETYRTE